MSQFSWSFLKQNQEISAASEQASQGRNIPYEKLPDGAQNQKVAQAIRNMVQGQTISGEIISIQGKEIQIAIDQNVILNARLEQTMNLALGQILNFEVKNNSSNQLTIRPLYANLTDDATLLKALDEAHLPPNEKNLAMAAALMEEGLPIDKKTLHAMQKVILSNPQVAPSFLAQMSRMQIPFTQENIQQFSAYKNYEHQMMAGIQTITDEIPTAIAAICEKTVGKEEMVMAMKELLEAFTQGGKTEPAKPAIVELVVPSTPQKEMGEQMKRFELPLVESNLVEENSLVQKEKTLESNTGIVPLAGIMGEKERTVLAGFFEKAGVDSETVALMKDGVLTPKEVLQIAVSLLKHPVFTGEEGKELFTSKEFSQVLKQEIMNQWTLEPHEVSKGKNIEELYTRIQEQAQRLLNSVGESIKGDSALIKSAVSLKENVDFINQLNQLVTYAQLPLKLSNQKAHGDLYVYTNKQSLAKKDGTVSALLHLEMEQLGSLDIHVALQKEKVSTKFYLQKEELLNFVEEHLYLLNERLEKRGYHMQAEVMQKENATNIMDEILDNEKNHMVVSQYAFDVRA